MTDLNKLIADLSGAPVKVQAEAIAVVRRGANNIKRDAQRFAPTGPHLPYYARSITYDTTVRVGDVEAVIGPDKDRPQGPLGNVLEFGSSQNAPLAHLGPALDLEGPRFMKALEGIAGDIL